MDREILDGRVAPRQRVVRVPGDLHRLETRGERVDSLDPDWAYDATSQFAIQQIYEGLVDFDRVSG